MLKVFVKSIQLNLYISEKNLLKFHHEHKFLINLRYLFFNQHHQFWFLLILLLITCLNAIFVKSYYLCLLGFSKAGNRMELKFLNNGVIIINSGYRGIKNFTGVPKPVFIFYQAMKTFVRFLPGYQKFLPQILKSMRH